MASNADFDWNKLKKYFSAGSTDDLNRFLEDLPHNAGYVVLMAAAVVWAVAAAAGLYTTIQLEKFTETKAQLEDMKALKPIVPVIKHDAVPTKTLTKYVDSIKEDYRGISLSVKGSEIIISAEKTSDFVEFREAISHIIYGGMGWRLSVSKMCVGRECKSRTKLMVSLKIDKVSVNKPKI